MNDSSKRIIVVTGSNKGVGFGIVTSLASQQSSDVIVMTSRSTELGEQARKEILSSVQSSGLDSRLVYLQLDITDPKSRAEFIKAISEKFGKIDVLVNNAGVAKKGDDFDTSVFDFTIKTNFYSTVDLTEEVIKSGILNENAKIISVASSAGKLKYLKNDKLKQEFLSNELTTEKIYDLCSRYRNAIDKNLVDSEGWSKNTYAFSKICLNQYTRILGNRKEVLDHGIQIYSCCPGWVRTDMAGMEATRSIEEGAVCPVYLVNWPHKINKEFQGKFFYDSLVSSTEN